MARLKRSPYVLLADERSIELDVFEQVHQDAAPRRATLARVDQVQDLLNDLIALQAHLQRAVRGQLAAKALEPHWDVRRLLEALEARLEVHLAELKGRLDGLGGRAASLEERAGTLLGAIAGRVDRRQRLSRSLRDDYIFLSLLLVTYGVLRVTAATLGDDASADLAGDHLDAIETTADELTVLIPAVVEAELAEAAAVG